MEVFLKISFFVILNIVLVFCAPSEKPTTPSAVKPIGKPALEPLDASNLETLNRETRKALLKYVGDELATARAMMNSIQPEVDECQRKVDQNYHDCLQCVDMKCQDRYRECNGSILIVAQNSGGVSVSSRMNERGLPVTSICTIIPGNTNACTKVMNPDGVFTTSINSMGDTLNIHLRSAANDLGSGVGMFINQMQNVVGDVNSSTVNEEIERMLNNLDINLSGMQMELQNMFNGIGQSFGGVQRSTSQVRPRVNNLFNSGQNGMQQSMTGLGNRMQQSMSNMGQQMNRGFGNGYFNLGQWGRNFGQTMNRMFSNLFGRKKRQAQIISDPSHEVRCEEFIKNSSVCVEYKTKCQACQATQNAEDTDVIRQVCGDIIVDKIVQIDHKLDELTIAEQAVITNRKIIEKVEIDKSSFNTDTFAFGNVAVTANIKGNPVKFSSKSALKIMDPPATGKALATQIWTYWNNPSVQKPV